MGAVSSTVFVTNGGTLDLTPNLANNVLNFGAKPFVVSGAGVGSNGAIIDDGTKPAKCSSKTSHWRAIQPSRWFRSGLTSAAARQVLSTGGNAFNLTRKGVNQINFVDAAIDTNLANINISRAHSDYRAR